MNLCTEVYDLSKPKPPEDAYHFYRHYIKNANGPILEPMCGTGRFLIPFIEEGYAIDGFDASEHMLTKLHEKAQLKNIQPNVWQGFTEELNSQKKYDLIFIPAGSFCLITDENKILASLKAFYNHLNDTGTLLFEIETKKSVPTFGNWRGSVWPKPDGTLILASFLCTLEHDICSSIGKYELVANNEILHTEIEEYKIKIYEQNDLIKLLESVGFKQIRTLKAFELNQKPMENDESIIYECKK